MTKIKQTVDIVIPALNEESIIATTVTECLKNNRRYILRVIVMVDGKTTDNTAKIAKEAGAAVYQTKEKRGKGAVFRKSFLQLKADYIVQIDADHQFQPNEISKLVDPLVEGCDITLGTRYQKGSMIEMYSVSFLKLFGSYFLSSLTSFFSGQKITDVMAGFKAFKKDTLLSLNLQTDHFGYEAEIVIKAAQMKYKIRNVPITYTARPVGSSSVSSIKHGLLVFGTILKTSFIS